MGLNYKSGGEGHINFRVISFFGKQFQYSPGFWGGFWYKADGGPQEINRKYIIQRSVPLGGEEFPEVCCPLCYAHACSVISESPIQLCD